MAQREIEIILTRQLASHLVMPTFIVDPKGTLLFYNEAAEPILGKRFDETGEISAEEWTAMFQPTDVNGRPVPMDEIPLMISLSRGHPAHLSCFIRGLDGVQRQIEVTSFALIGQAKRIVGGVSFFWEVPSVGGK